MSTSKPRICSNGHKFYKSSDCPTFPVCEKEILELHGMGPGSIPKLTNALKEKRLSFKENC